MGRRRAVLIHQFPRREGVALVQYLCRLDGGRRQAKSHRHQQEAHVRSSWFLEPAGVVVGPASTRS